MARKPNQSFQTISFTLQFFGRSKDYKKIVEAQSAKKIITKKNIGELLSANTTAYITESSASNENITIKIG